MDNKKLRPKPSSGSGSGSALLTHANDKILTHDNQSIGS
jgi:hypothetical protein